MTFTRAAAGEMKESISAAIEKHSVSDPDNEHLGRDRQPCFILHRLQLLMVSVPILSGITYPDRTGSGISDGR